MDTMERLKEWVEQGKRSVEITFNTHLSFNLSIWVYDYDLMVGIHVTISMYLMLFCRKLKDLKKS